MGNSDKIKVDKNSQVAEPRGDQSCCVVIPDSISTETVDKRNGRGCLYLCRRYKRIFLIAAALLIGLNLMLEIIIAIMLLLSHVQYTSGRVSLDHFVDGTSLSNAEVAIDGNSFSNDWTKLANETVQKAEGKIALLINAKVNGTAREKREVSREKDDCDISAEKCRTLLKSMYKYLEALKNEVSDQSRLSTFSDILKCLKCRNLKSATATGKFGENFARRSNGGESYPPYIHVERNQSRDSPESTVMTELSANTGDNEVDADFAAGDGGVDSLETPDIRIAKTDPANSGRTLRTSRADVDDADIQPDDDRSIARDPDAAKIQSDSASVTTAGNLVNEHRAIEAAKMVPGNVATLNVAETSTITSTRIEIKEESTQNINSATSQPAVEGDVMGIGYDGGATSSMHSSSHPSFEGHPEDERSTTVATEPAGTVSIANDSVKPVADGQNQIGQSMQGNRQLQMTSMMSWPMPHLICYSGQLFNKSSSLENRNPLSLQSLSMASSSSSSSMPNYVQAQQAQLVQFITRLSYSDNLARPQPPEAGDGPAGLGAPNKIPVLSLSQQQQSNPFSEERYFCTYVSAPILPFSSPIFDQSHFARSSLNEAEASKEPSERLNENLIDGPSYNPEYFSACPSNSRRCAGDGYCILKVKWCDGRVDCPDASDETTCSCRDRISRDRLCDGYFDCPHGEDEIGCFNCPDNHFSCDDWDQRHSLDNCIPLSQRCDGAEQCHNGKDELDCHVLSASHIDGKDILTIGYTEGYLHKNVQGRWYSVCLGEASWAMDACASGTGQSITVTPKIEMIRVSANDFPGPYLNGSDGQMQLVDSCSGSAMFVKCPPLLCGTRGLQESFLTSDTTARGHSGYDGHTEEEQPAVDFDELYLEMLQLLNEQYAEENKKDGNNTLVEPLLGVVGGRPSQPKTWPFLVAIYKDGSFHCDGVILTEVWVLTAAHCMVEYEKHYYEIQAGALRRSSFSPIAQWRRARSVLVHADFNSPIMQNDIALIMLDERLFFNRWIRQACLPAGSEWQLKPTPRSVCLVVGWGVTEFGLEADQLREVEVPILSSCKYSPDRNAATICAGYPQGGHDACQGDSGGPLLCRDPNFESQFYVAGVISHGNGCALPDEPGAYTRVSYFMPWIQKQIAEELPMLSNENTSLATCPGFRCREKFGRCLPIEKQCDGVVDCLDAEDEVGCPWRTTDTYGSRQSDSDNEFVQMEMNKISANFRAANETRTEMIPSLNVGQGQIDKTSGTVNAATPETTPRTTFTCTRLIQTITINKRCNKRLDCEDGTDEQGCTCRDYLSNFQPTTICDGHVDCDDETDEENCGMCTESEFHCSRSGSCIPAKNRCDGKFDCAGKEDEVDCLALINGEHVNVDSDDRPELNIAGLLARYTNGMWRTECPKFATDDNDILATIRRIGERVCRYLGFRNVQSAERVYVNRIRLGTRGRRDNGTDYEVGDVDGPCWALWIHCRPVLSGSADSHLIADPKTGGQTHLWPWLATIFVDGRYRCSAVLLKPDWLLSDSGCTRDIRLSVNYTTALLGYSRAYLHVDGPYQQISVVDEIKEVRNSDVSLLHLRTAVNLTRHVLPLFLQEKFYPPENNDLCVAVGTDKERTTQSVFLQPVLENCAKCHRCFVERTRSECSSNDTADWAGTVVCHGQAGWYPAAVFHEKNGPCSFRSTRNLTSIDYVHAYITQILDGKRQPTAEKAPCHGIRCNIGKCVSWDRVCDGVVDCRDGVDEMDTCGRSYLRDHNLYEVIDHRCTKTELRCGNGQCKTKDIFCNGIVDCWDGTDEPVHCTCAEYLRLTAPERLCDGVRHCLDKSDESPDVCHCTDSSFRCDMESGNSTCIPQDFVCDDDQDCPNGRDEKQCIKLGESADNKPGRGEVLQRSYGVWHSRCFSAPVASDEADIVCKKLGYTNGTIERVTTAPVVPSFDGFHTIRVNLETWVIMRDNNKSLISFVPSNDSCHSLFVKCA